MKSIAAHLAGLILLGVALSVSAASSSSAVAAVVASTPGSGLVLNARATDTTSGVFSKYVYAIPLPTGNTNITGLSGNVSISAITTSTASTNQNSTLQTTLSEALFSVGYARNMTCPPGTYLGPFVEYKDLYEKIPGAVILGQFIVKAYGTQVQTVNTNVSFPTPLSASGCAFVIMDGGIPKNTGNSVTMYSAVKLIYGDGSAASAVRLGLGDEFCTGMDSGCEATVAGNRVLRNTLNKSGTFASAFYIGQSGTLQSLYGNVSHGKLDTPDGRLNTSHQFYIDRGCAQFAKFNLSPSLQAAYTNEITTMAGTATPILNLQFGGKGTDLQSLVTQPVNTFVKKGDCLAHLVTINGSGALDSETQISAVLVPGSTLLPRPANPAYPSQAMYRLLNKATGVHFFTTSRSEIPAGFSYEGVAFKFLLGSGMPGTRPLYRCNAGGKRFFSLDASCEDYAQEGIYGSVYTQNVEGSQPIRRMINANNGDRLETVNLNEGLIAGYVLETDLGFVPQQ